MPRKKRESMLQRQRRKLKTEKAMKASKKQLPSKGGSSGGSTKARVQRGMTRDKMAKQQLTNFARALKKTLKQSAAQSKLNIAAKGTKGTGVRTAGAGGGLAKRTSSALARRNARKGGSLTKSDAGALKGKGGGALAKRGSSPTKSDVQKVKVKDLGTTKGGSLVKSSKGALKVGAKGAMKYAGKALGVVGAGMAIKDEVDKIKKLNKVTFGRPQKGSVKSGEKYGPPASKNKGTIGGLIKPTSKPKASKSTSSNFSTTKPAASQSTSAKAQPTKPKADHGKHTGTINRLMKRYQELRKLKKFKEADSLGKRIHAMKYEKSDAGIRIRR